MIAEWRDLSPDDLPAGKVRDSSAQSGLAYDYQHVLRTASERHADHIARPANELSVIATASRLEYGFAAVCGLCDCLLPDEPCLTLVRTGAMTERGVILGLTPCALLRTSFERNKYSGGRYIYYLRRVPLRLVSSAEARLRAIDRLHKTYNFYVDPRFKPGPIRFFTSGMRSITIDFVNGKAETLGAVWGYPEAGEDFARMLNERIQAAGR